MITKKGMEGKGSEIPPAKQKNIFDSLGVGSTQCGRVDEAALQMVIRQEDTLNILKQSTSWVLFAKTESPSVIPGLVTASQKWKEEITKPNSQFGGISLRTTLLWRLLKQLMEIFKNLTEEQKQKAKEAGWCTDQGLWVYQKWSPANQALEQETTRSPLQASAIMKLIEELTAMTTSEIVSAFHSKRPLTPNTQGAMVVLQLGVNFRKTEADQFYEKLEQLMGQASLQLGGLQIRSSGDETHRAHSVRTLILRNNANHCYASTAIRALLWAVAADSRLETLLTNKGCSLIRGLLTT